MFLIYFNVNLKFITKILSLYLKRKKNYIINLYQEKELKITYKFYMQFNLIIKKR